MLLNNEGVFKVLLVASNTKKAEHLASMRGIPVEETKESLQTSDVERKHMVERLFKRDWLDPHNYNITINNTRITDKTDEWYSLFWDPYSPAAGIFPSDYGGHGTHVAGTVAGNTLRDVSRMVRPASTRDLQPLLKELHRRGLQLYLASGTDIDDVTREAEKLGYRHLFSERIYGATGDITADAKKLVLERILHDIGQTSSSRVLTPG
jgi:subtilisin family serine protease